MKKKSFNPLLFLASLGAGGISVMPFSLLQYNFPHGKGLIKISDIVMSGLGLPQQVLMYFLYAVMIFFTIMHLVLTVVFLAKLFGWLGSAEQKEMSGNPLKNSALVTPFLSLAMTMNVFIAPVRFFIPSFANNLQAFMLPAVIVWSVLWLALLITEIRLLKVSFVKGFDLDKINFGWLLHPFAIGMVTVTGSGIAAMAKNPNVAHFAAFLSMITFSMGLFLLSVKMVTLFKSHFNADGLPEKQFMPSFLIVVPNVTLYALTAFRLGHYYEHQFGVHLPGYFTAVIMLSFAFEIWYLLFGLALMKDYFKEHFFKKEFYVSQWGFVCPVVAFGVLGSFANNMFVPNPFFYTAIVAAIVIASLLFFKLFIGQLVCSGLMKDKNMNCS